MDTLSRIKSPIAHELEQFKSLFDASLATSNELLNDVIVHIRQRQGKMMRPMLLLLTARLCGQNNVTPATFYAAVSLELLHTASLIHDDVVDESAERRGQPSVNALYNNKVAVLVGDYLLATSLAQVSRTGNRAIVEVVSRLGQSLSEGELIQLSNVSKVQFSEASYFEVISKKTAALFTACTEVGALSVGASPEQVELACRIGHSIGLCFQIRDDIFDYYNDPGIGKPTGNDMLEGKLTLPVLHALNATPDEAGRTLALRVKEGKATSGEIATLMAFAKAHGGITYAEQVMRREQQKVQQLLASLPDTAVKEALLEYVNYVVERDR
ncbi:MAG: polyprenyl synthetase family protein [Prevotellaceae bacterium]|jgi:octaprenyl-diphosphate synthase|nr:polyprenyl synthetase family protein [Prevotellaceae bacterium]